MNEGDKVSLKTYKIFIEEVKTISHRSRHKSQLVATHRKMKITIALVIIASLSTFADAADNIKKAAICKKFNMADDFLHKWVSKGLSVKQLPIDKLILVKNAIRNGVDHGCDQQVKPAYVECKRFTQRGRSVVCKN